MSTGLEAAADIATGALLGRAVEPVAGDLADAAHNTRCLNCDAALTGSYCITCGQKAHVHRTLRGFGHDLIHGVFHFDGKIWRTLPMLFWYPGELTQRYIHGERAKFVSPLALFLFTVFLTFAVFSYIAPQEIEANTKLMPNESDKVARKFAEDKSKSEILIKQLEADLAAAKKAKQPVEKIEEQLEAEQLTVKMLDMATNTLNSDKQTGSNVTFTDVKIGGSDWLNEAGKHALQNPQLLLYKIQSNAYKFSWALIPISLPFLWLLFFWRRQFKLFDHAVFITYSLCFMMMLSAMGGLILSFSGEGNALFPITVLLVVFVPPLHIYRQLHRAYQISRFGAFWRTILLSYFALMAFCLFALMIFILGIAG